MSEYKIDPTPALRSILIDNERIQMLLPEVMQDGLPPYRPIFCGAILGQEVVGDQDAKAVLFIKDGNEDLTAQFILQSAVRMICIAPSFGEAEELRDACVTVLYDLAKVDAVGIMVHSVSIGSDQVRLDFTSQRTYTETALTVVSDIRSTR